jgi:hypothetical protein
MSLLNPGKNRDTERRCHCQIHAFHHSKYRLVRHCYHALSPRMGLVISASLLRFRIPVRPDYCIAHLVPVFAG